VDDGILCPATLEPPDGSALAPGCGGECMRSRERFSQSAFIRARPGGLGARRGEPVVEEMVPLAGIEPALLAELDFERPDMPYPLCRRGYPFSR